MRSLSCRIVIITVLSFTLSVIDAQDVRSSQDSDPEAYVYSIENQGLYRFDSTSGEGRVIYDLDGMHRVTCSVSPSRQLVALSMTEMGATEPKMSIVFVDTDGAKVATLDRDVRKFAWSPAGTEVAYISGNYREGGAGFLSTGLHIFDVIGGTTKRIGDRAYYLNWASFDGNIYYYDHKNVFKYNPTTENTKETAYHGVNFSPDGKYYTTSSVEQDYNVYLTATNEPVTERLRARFKKWTYMPSWNLAYTHHLQVTEIEHLTSPADAGQQVRVSLGIKQKKHALYDVEQDVIVKEWIETPDE